MDILTPRGKQSLEEERKAIAAFLGAFPEYSWAETPKDEPAILDGFFCRDGVVSSAVEVKCRWLTRSYLSTNYRDEWLISQNKLSVGTMVSGYLRVPFVTLLWLVPESRLFITKFTDSTGASLLEYETRATTTSLSINGGKRLRLNAFIPMRYCKEIDLGQKKKDVLG